MCHALPIFIAITFLNYFSRNVRFSQTNNISKVIKFRGVFISASDPVITVPAVGGASISIPENQALNSVIYTVEASDDDGDTLTYSIKTITPSSDPKFTISGADLQVSEALDYESVTSYTIIFEYAIFS